MIERLRALLTEVAVWWLQREWPHGDIPDPREVPRLDTSDHPTIIIGPGVIRPPGLMFDSRPPPDPPGPLIALGAYGMRDGVSYMLGRPRVVNTSEEGQR